MPAPMRNAARAVAVAGLSLGLSACAQTPAPGDAAYSRLAPRAEVLARNTVQTALETATSDSSLEWSFAEDGSKGTVMPLRTYMSTTGFYCREYVELVETTTNGRNSRQRTACRDLDGVWKPLRS